MKKLAILFISVLMAQYSFAEAVVSGTASVVDANTGFDLPLAVSGANSPSSEAKEAEKESVSINAQMEIVATVKHEEDAQLPYTIDVSYPQITGENLSTQAKEFNRLVNEMVSKSVQQFKNYVKADMPHMQTLPESVKHNGFNINYDIDVVKPVNHILISLRLSIEGMQAGRAHPYHTHQVLNFDLNKGKVLTLKDLFKSRANYLSVFAKYASKELNDKLQDKWMINDGTAPLAKNYQLWNLEDDGILITFEEYQVAPYAAGPQEVEVPYSLLKNLVAPDAPIAVCAKAATGCTVEN